MHSWKPIHRSTANMATAVEQGVKQGVVAVSHGLVPLAAKAERQARGEWCSLWAISLEAEAHIPSPHSHA